MNNFMLDGIEDAKFILKRLVLINSGGHAYSEIMLDSHMALFGHNNVGKTASLAATKLLLFPETNLRNCKNTFRFQGKLGVYDGPASYKFYFPTEVSFLALEVENPRGTFCMVAYKPNAKSAVDRYDYNRVFVEGPYDFLRPIFWDIEQGDFQQSISVASLLEYSKKKNGKDVSDSKTLIDIMFGSHGRADGQFCLVPLKDTGTDSIKAFRDIYNLAFASTSIESEVLPSALAALIEMKRGREKEKLESTLADEFQKFELLNLRRIELENREVNQPKFQQLSDAFSNLNDRILQHSIHHHTLSQWLNESMATHAPKLKANQEAYTEATTQRHSIKSTLDTLKEDWSKARTTSELKKDAYKARLAQKNKCEELISRYPGQTCEQVLVLKKNFKEETTSLFNALENKESAEKHWNTKQVELRHKQGQLTQINTILAQQSSMLMNQVSPHSSQILHVINPELNKIFSNQLNAHDLEIIESFTNLFSIANNETIYFKDQSLDAFHYLHFDPEQTMLELSSKRESLMTQIHKLEDDIEQLKDLIARINIDEFSEIKRSELHTQLKECEDDIFLLESFKVFEHELPLLKAASEEAVIQAGQIRIKLEGQQELYDQMEERCGHLSAESNYLQELNGSFEQIQKNLNSSNANNWLIIEESIGDLSESLDKLPINIASIRNLALDLSIQANAINSEVYQFRDVFKNFMIEVPLPNVEPHLQIPTMLDLKVSITAYNSIYTTLNHQRTLFNNDVSTHNKALRAQINEISDARMHLKRHVEMINKNFNGYQISNLTEIKLNMKTKADFDALNYALDKFNVGGDTLPDKEFYLSLLNFFKKNQSANGRLHMVNLIDSIGYQFTKPDGSVVDTSQSGGTTTAITAFVLSILLSEIKEVGMKVHLPIVVDEIAALDAENSETVIRQISEHGFSIFCATPDYKANIAKCVGRYIHIDENRPKNVLIPSCQLHLLPHHVESFGVKNEAPTW